MQKKRQIIFLGNAALLFFAGLWDLFSAALPEMEKSSMLSIFPRVYPIIISALLLFVFPLYNGKSNFWHWLSLLLSFMVSITAAVQLLSASERFLSLAVLLISNLLMNLFSLLLLLKKDSNHSVPS